MTKINARDIIGLPVETRHGVLLGKVVDFEVDAENSVVLKYRVAPASLVKQLVAPEPELLIAPEQVVTITAEKMVVVDLDAGEAVDAGEELELSEKETKKAESVGTSSS